MGSLGESAFMRRVQALVSGCCYCGSLYHDTTNCPWRPPMSEQNNTDEMSSPLPGGECDYSTLSREQLVEGMIRNGNRADELQRVVFLRGEDLTNLRARLAKYEDAEGRPVVPAALGRAFITGESGEAGYRVVIKSETLQETQQVHNWLATLNSSPVSAGANLIRFDFTNAQGQPDSKMMTHDEMRQRYSDLLISNALALGGSAVSAGVMDERAAAPTVKDCMRRAGYEDYHGRIAFTVGQFERFVELVSDRAIQARTARSAPSHGEQVREVVPEPVRDALARRCLWLAFCWNDHNFGPAHEEARKEALKHGIDSFDAANEWLAASPSAGSQKEQGE